MRKPKSIITKGVKPARENYRYPWGKLVKPGDQFIWARKEDENSLRVGAVKLGKRRSIVLSVSRIEEGILVTLVRMRIPDPPKE